MATKKKGDLITDLAGGLLSGSGLNLDTILDAAGKSLPGILNKGEQYPVITASNWNTLVTKFQRNVPVSITKKWAADNLSVTQAYAEKSVLPELQKAGLIDSKGKSTARAQALGSANTYAKACERILKDVYPDDLLAMNSSTKTDQNRIIAWFKKAAGTSDTNAKRMASTYLLLLKEASATQETAAAVSKSSAEKKVTETKATDRGVSITVRLDFPSKSMAQKFDEILSAAAEQVHAKVEKLS